MTLNLFDPAGLLSIHPSHRRSFKRVFEILLLLAAIQFVSWLMPTPLWFNGIPDYLPLHTLLETISIVVSMMVFAVGWNSKNRDLPGNIILLACVYFAVGVLDFSHTASYVGMPDFITPNDSEKHLNFWLSARFLSAAILLVVAVRPWEPFVSIAIRYLIFISLIALTLCINWVVVYHQGWLPDTFIPGQGLTPFKKNMEYVIITLNIITAGLLIAKMRGAQTFNIVLFFGAVCTMAMSELFFTLYSTMTGAYNVLGHIYKVISYLFIYRAVVVATIEAPYNRSVQLKNELETQLRHTRTLMKVTLDSLCVLDTEGNLVECNDAFCSLLGYTAEEACRLNLADWNAELSKEQLLAGLRNAVGTSVRFETLHRRKDGSLINVEVGRSSVELDGKHYFIASSHDITERKQAEIGLMRYKATLATTHDGFWLIDSQCILLEANQAYADMSGYAVDELAGMHISRFEAKELSLDEIKAHAAKIVSQGWDVFETRHRCKDGHEIDLEVSTTYLAESKQFVSFLRDITSRKEAEEQIEHLAFYDPLTRLPNRRLLLDRLQQALVSSIRSGKVGALLFIDLDNFKTLNDTLGHDIGDLLLQMVAERLTMSLREGDSVSRFGGDEFVVILEGLSETELEAATQAELIAHKIITTLNRSYQLDSHTYRNTPSIGATLFGKNKQGIDDLLKQADIAMYQAKNAGRNTFRFFDKNMQIAINNRVELESALRQAVDLEQFQLYYQVQVNASQQVTGAEVLIRWQHPERGMVSPAQFIPLAEETGLILPIGKWVLETACKQIKAWQDNERTKHLTLSVNVSGKQFHERSFSAQLEAMIQRYAINPNLLKLEPTESILLEDIEETIGIMNTLRAIGIQFALDDFGTGFSSLQYLKRLPLTQLKIDQSFIRDLASDSNDLAIVRTIIAMAHSLGLEIIAEGVETEDQKQILLFNGCSHFQGYLFGRPVPIKEFEASLI